MNKFHKGTNSLKDTWNSCPFLTLTDDDLEVQEGKETFPAQPLQDKARTGYQVSTVLD